MVSFPNAKINIGLEIISRRTDGYHNLQSVFVPIPLYDALEFVESGGNSDVFETSGLPVPGDPLSNLCLKALKLVRQHATVPPLHIHLHKNIPMGAGLGGGSSDAVFFLNMLDEFFTLGLTLGQKEKMAAQLGSDCNFFLHNTPMRVTGTGSDMEASSLSLSGYYLVLVYPAIHINTAAAFSSVTPRLCGPELFERVEKSPPEAWTKVVVNHFEAYVFNQYPQVKLVKESLYRAGALYASMSGSGSAVYGIFPGTAELPDKEIFNTPGGNVYQLQL